MPTPSRSASFYKRELDKSVELRERLAHATLASTPWTCDASIYDSARAADQGVLLVGDAASFIEPLSSAGVKKALLSAWRAAVVANTCLRNPALAGAAQDLTSRASDRSTPSACGARARFRGGGGRLRHPVLVGARRGGARRRPCRGGPRRLRRGHERRRASPATPTSGRRSSICVRPTISGSARSAALRFAPVAIIEGREVVMRDALIVPASTRRSSSPPASTWPRSRASRPPAATCRR